MTKNKDVYDVTFGFEAVTAPRQRSFINEEQKFDSFKPDSIVSSLINEHVERAKMGQAKYNNTLDRTDLSLIDYLQHTKEELMDAALYIEKTIQMLQGKK